LLISMLTADSAGLLAGRLGVQPAFTVQM